MKIAIGNDHHGIEIKNKIMSYLTERNIEYVNLGCDEVNNVDYVDYAAALCQKVRQALLLQPNRRVRTRILFPVLLPPSTL